MPKRTLRSADDRINVGSLAQTTVSWQDNNTIFQLYETFRRQHRLPVVSEHRTHLHRIGLNEAPRNSRRPEVVLCGSISSFRAFIRLNRRARIFACFPAEFSVGDS